MAHGRVGLGVAFLLAFAGTATAQPVYSGAGFGGSLPPAPLPGAMQPTMPGAYMPAALPPGVPSPMPGAPNVVPMTGFAEDHPPMRELPTGLPDLHPPPAHGGHGGHGGHGEHHEIPGYMTPFVPEHGGWYTSGEFLLMRARNSDFDYVLRNSGVGLATVGPIESLKYGLGTGLRVEGGRRWGEGKWESGFAYTYYTTGDTSTVFAGPGQVLLPTLTRPGLTDRALTATADADLDYHLFDILVGRRVLVDDHFALRWIGGLRFTDIRQILNTFYDGADARRAAVNTRSQFQGFGPLVGAEAVVVGWKGFHVYSRATAGLLSGRDVNRVIETNDNGQTTYINTNYDVRKVVPMGSIAIGGGWQYRTISLRAGYEVTYWHGIFERPRFVDDVSQGKVITRPSNLSLEGLFLQVGLSF